jgi:hypothetical protein
MGLGDPEVRLSGRRCSRWIEIRTNEVDLAARFIERHGSRPLLRCYRVGDRVVVCALLTNKSQSPISIGTEHQTPLGIERGVVGALANFELRGLFAVGGVRQCPSGVIILPSHTKIACDGTYRARAPSGLRS